MKKISALFLISGLVLAWGCTKSDSEKPDLKQSLDKSITELNAALKDISLTQGYQLLSSSDLSLKSEIDYSDSITLDMVAGIYSFSPNPFRYHNFFIPFRLFRKTGESDKMIVNLPEKLAFRPLYLHNLNPPDSAMKKNFTITADNYHYYFSRFNKSDYQLSAGLTLNDENIGSLEVESLQNPENGRAYSSSYAFEEGHEINVSFQSGDTTVSTFALSEDGEDLMSETSSWIVSENNRMERVYVLAIGNIEIKKASGMDSIQVYLDGVLQEKAAVKITDGEDPDGSVCHHRDIMLTFDDGTTIKLSELLEPSREILRNLFSSLHSMNFAKHVVDYIAISIYYHQNH